MRRLFIIRKDLNLTPGKMGAMVGHCCEAYWTNMLKQQYQFAVDNKIPTLGPDGKQFYVLIQNDIWNEYVNGIFTKTICEAKNLNELRKAESKAKELKLVEGRDWGYINDCCLTELKPENPDGTTTIGIWFKPLEDDIAHQISKKFKLYGCFDRKRNCDVYRTYDEARKAYMESHPVTDTNETMMKWLFEPYQEKKNEEEGHEMSKSPSHIFALVRIRDGKVIDSSSDKLEMLCRCVGYNDFVGHEWGVNDIGKVVFYGDSGPETVKIPQELIDKIGK